MRFAFTFRVSTGQRIFMGKMVDPVFANFQNNVITADEAIEGGVGLGFKICVDGLPV
jgi:hypothetical protein